MNELEIVDYKIFKHPDLEDKMECISMIEFHLKGGYDGEDTVSISVYNPHVGVLGGVSLTVDKFTCEIDCRESIVYIEHFLEAKKLAEDWINEHYPQPSGKYFIE